MVCRRSVSRSLSSRSSHSMWDSMPGRTAMVVAVLRRFFSATSMAMSWCLRATREWSNWVSASHRGRTGGPDRFAEVCQHRGVKGVGLCQPFLWPWRSRAPVLG